MKKLIFISVLAFSFLACEDKSTKEKVNDSKNSLENGDANSSFKYFEGIVAELVSLQIIYLNIFDHIESSKEPEDAKTQELAHKLLDESNRIVLIPKIRFKFKLDYGESYQMMRCQFPLRLAYCMTYIKSQSQTFEKILLDCIGEPFTHGHLYVATSRIRNC